MKREGLRRAADGIPAADRMCKSTEKQRDSSSVNLTYDMITCLTRKLLSFMQFSVGGTRYRCRSVLGRGSFSEVTSLPVGRSRTLSLASRVLQRFGPERW